jgi:hypothetical protein
MNPKGSICHGKMLRILGWTVIDSKQREKYLPGRMHQHFFFSWLERSNSPIPLYNNKTGQGSLGNGSFLPFDLDPCQSERRKQE